MSVSISSASQPLTSTTSHYAQKVLKNSYVDVADAISPIKEIKEKEKQLGNLSAVVAGLGSDTSMARLRDAIDANDVTLAKKILTQIIEQNKQRQKRTPVPGSKIGTMIDTYA